MVIQRAAAAFDDDERWGGGGGRLPVQLADRVRGSEGGPGAQLSLLTTHNEEFHFPSSD